MQIINSDSYIDINQHFKVSAGPGAGKTKFLINHIKNVLRNSERLGRNRKIACITYTNVGVETILQRLGDETDHVEVSTIHSFLYTHIVKPYMFLISDKYGIDPTNIDSPCEHIVSNGYLSRTDLATRFFVREKDMKNVYWEVSDETCKLHLRHRDRDKGYHKSLLKYKKFFWEKGIIHYEDILAFSWEILKSFEEVLRIIRSKFPYFFIDEFQDTNPIQTNIIKLIAQNETIIGVIGDKAQSIYEFQGADVKQFNDFSLPNISLYRMEDNYRSTENIISILNNIRKDIEQKNPLNKKGNSPVIIVGEALQALKTVQEILGEQSFTSLSYSNLTANAIRNNKPIEEGDRWKVIEEDFDDSDSKRRKIFISLIKAIELARLSHYKESLRELSRHVKKTDNFNGEKTALIVIKTLLNDYYEFNSKPLWFLYDKIVSMGYFQFPKIRESKNAKVPSKAEKYYKETLYSDIALYVKIAEDVSLHCTIHKAKGSEFDNVLLIVKGRDGKKYIEERDLGFLLDPDIDENEEHRVYYVACSRARENLFINVPEITEETKNKLQDMFDFKYVSDRSLVTIT
ncbi:hypothetical protein AM501_24870 [Aneurinibacillus migulanus]|nr:hypothetical protein TS64_04760 [Aneurinibacillus migulanus]KPD05688.1 hypothetical protein AM501_24870 [Aneurinibacillus migulanus]CEH28366.1 ATP-dependent DNA helicase UvrD [Aneurinibacillus migulanus]